MFSCSPIKMVRELGLERPETVWSLSAAQALVQDLWRSSSHLGAHGFRTSGCQGLRVSSFPEEESGAQPGGP